MITKKVVLIGDYSTGKTSLIRRFVDNQFSDVYLSTIGVKISRKKLSIQDDEVQNIIWDIEGATEKKPLNTTYLMGAHGAIIVADVSREVTLENIQNFIDLLKEKSLNIPFVIALNKCDLLGDNSAVFSKISEQYSQAGSIHLTSAKNAQGVEEIFETLTVLMME